MDITGGKITINLKELL